MITLIRQELYKLFKRKKTYVVILGFILLTIFIAYNLKSHSDYMREYNSPEFQVENIKNQIGYMEEDLKNIPEEIKNDEKEKESYIDSIEQEIIRLNQELEYYQNLANSNLTWQEILAERIRSQEEYIKENETNLGLDDLSRAKMEFNKLKYLQENNIKPQEDYEFNSLIFLETLIEQIGPVFLLIGIAVFASDMVSGEWTPPTLKLLLTQPISRGKVILSKFLATVISTVGLILLIELIFFLIIGVFYDFGNFDYPIIVDKIYQFDTSIVLDNGSHPIALADGGYNIIPASSYLVRLLINQALLITTITSFVFLISSLAKSSMVSMATSVVSLIGATIILQLTNLYGLRKYIFIIYTSTSSLITGDFTYYMNDPRITNSLGIIVLAVWAIICYLISHYVFTKRDMLV